MPDPTRPIVDAPTAATWGQAVHDAVFTPRGVRVAGGSSQAVGTTYEQLPLNTAVDDPGGWLSGDAITLPSGASGLYEYWLVVQTDNGEADERTRCQLRVNGVSALSFFIGQDGTTAIQEGKSGLLNLDALDVITVYAAKTGGTDPDVIVVSLAILRRGSEVGA
jgi:hypothetical protein